MRSLANEKEGNSKRNGDITADENTRPKIVPPNTLIHAQFDIHLNVSAFVVVKALEYH